jgi:type IV fimbrial biogenesis protein FimT
MLDHEKRGYVLSAFSTAESSGFTLIEMLIVVAIIAIATTLGLPSYKAWIQNTQIRNAAESIQTGLQRARAEAIRLNSNVQFSLLGTSGNSWSAGWQAASSVGSVVSTTLLDSSSGREGSKNVTAKGFTNTTNTTPDATTITFSSLAAVTTNADASATLRVVKLDSSVLPAADSRDLWVTIGGVSGVGSSIRMCDPNLTSGPTACN